MKYRLLSARPSRVFGLLLTRLAQPDLIIPYYHLVSDNERPHIKHLYEHKNVAQFERDIDFLAMHYRSLGMQDLIETLATGRLLTSPCFLLTFDDGFREMHDIVAPILMRKGIPATFFVNNAFLDNRKLCHHHKASVLVEEVSHRSHVHLPAALRLRLYNGSSEQRSIAEVLVSIPYQEQQLLDDCAADLGVDFTQYLSHQRPYLSTEEVRSLISRGFAVGGHSVDHPLFADLSLQNQLRQTLDSVSFIRERFQLDYGVFAFPQSDRAVTREYFSHLAESGVVDLTFGTGGMVDDEAPNHLQRCSMEYPLLPAESILAYHAARRLHKKIVGRSLINRL